MTKDRAIEIIKTERLCVLKNENKSCDRDCAKCDLVMETDEIIEAYNMAVEALKGGEHEDNN